MVHMLFLGALTLECVVVFFALYPRDTNFTFAVEILVSFMVTYAK